MAAGAQDVEQGREAKFIAHSRQSSGWSIASGELEIAKRKFMRRWSSKQWIAVLLICVVCTGLLSQVLLTKKPWMASPQDHNDIVLEQPHVVEVAVERPRHHKAVVGPPTLKFRDNLRNDTRYVTSWLSAGFTNDVMTLGNLIYLARITNRVPVLPPLDSYIGKRPVAIPFSAIFDLPRLERELRMDIVEWKDVKYSQSEEVDVLGCWGVFQVADLHTSGPRFSRNAMDLKLDLSYTKAPASVKLIPGFEHDSHSSFWSLAPLAFSDLRAKALASMDVETLPGPWTGAIALPDEQMVCYDYLFYVCADVPAEFERDVYPAWEVVQKHFRWTIAVERVGQEYLRRVLNVSSDAVVPPHITIHARHGDFKDWCNEYDPQACFASLATFAKRVAELKDELRTTKGIQVEHVIMTSDEQDAAWWDQVREMGWLSIDHDKEGTTERHGEWYPVIVDAYVQSAGIGFVGTDRSTFSTIARLRVRDWNGGAVRMVKWGKPDADD